MSINGLNKMKIISVKCVWEFGEWKMGIWLKQGYIMQFQLGVLDRVYENSVLPFVKRISQMI